MLSLHSTYILRVSPRHDLDLIKQQDSYSGHEDLSPTTTRSSNTNQKHSERKQQFQHAYAGADGKPQSTSSKQKV